MKNAVIVTLGCRLNQADSALIADRLRRDGYEIVDGGAEKVDLVVVNSCAVTAQAVAKTRQAVAKWRNRFPESEIVLTGCAAEAEFEKFSADPRIGKVKFNPGKRDLFGADAAEKSLDVSREDFAESAQGFFPFRHRALVKIQEGCDNFCTYCIVPYVRGPARSRRAAEVIAECERLVAAGIPEIVLTGVNTCLYDSGGMTLGGLVREVCSIPGDFRVRLSSTEPRMDNLELLADLAACGDKLCSFLHLSLQHGDDAILRAMNRRYTTAEFAAFAAEARRIRPDLHLGTDVIVGFPGETAEAFARSCGFIESMAFANIHIFSYSPRPGTPAATFPGRVPPPEAKRRHGILAKLAEESAAAFRASQRGTVLKVIFEEVKQGRLHGWSDNYLEVFAPAGSAPIGKIVDFALTE
ncbi:MAG: tRNA (N(6)-L-threonylcarbamoyladenosine(37)-C(2))-methylthiotransferase MtaB [Victivallaceae bacterium]